MKFMHFADIYRIKLLINGYSMFPLVRFEAHHFGPSVNATLKRKFVYDFVDLKMSNQLTAASTHIIHALLSTRANVIKSR